MTYIPDAKEHMLVLRETATMTEAVSGVDDETLVSILDGVGSFAQSGWGDLNAIADTVGARIEGSEVTMPPGLPDAYAKYVSAGWGTLPLAEGFGGQGLPFSLAMAVQEVLGASNFALTSCTTLTAGAIEAILHHGSDAQKAVYLPRLGTGEWTGTMNLTEPQAGTDVGALKTTATPLEDGTWSIRGMKIFISFADHDLTDNIVHLVLARTPGAPAGTKGISLFLAPKFRADDDGEFTVRNGMNVVSIEHKAGFHASPTCVVAFGESEPCIGELIGKENQGMRAMFTMMNSARIGVGHQGVQLGEAATQKAVAYAQERIQGRRNGQPVPIIEFPDVRRMLLRMKALTQGSRALLFYAAGCLDRAAAGDKKAAQRLELMTPLAKAYGSEVGVEIASLGMQVHGGMGYIEETGAAQYWKDARIAPIYEGTTGIQAADLVGRKLAMEDGAAFAALISDMRASAKHPELKRLIDLCEDVADRYATASADDRLAGSYSFLMMVSVAVSGWLLERQLEAVTTDDFGKSKAVVVRFYLEHLVPEAAGLWASATAGSELLYELAAEAF
ncbi:acyl-CoA dehydrogenase [Sulfitobacter dubius]|uniref:acyl-CoA dehydrogenase n=1 Tax=Sulfitobacter dubius TaxID=218673 RepID=UPI0022AF860A|nr:acyl-CoA dehydrogenase [Sulfitobacter dubius]MCZ4366307.1 acyl-CoA dehydrogenase [Sulfitobacter dubius]